MNARLQRIQRASGPFLKKCQSAGVWYLTTHDWSGEFTAKEIQAWLDDGADEDNEECENMDENEEDKVDMEQEGPVV